MLTLQGEIKNYFCTGVDSVQKNILLTLQSLSENEVYMEEGEGKQKMSKLGILGFIECQYDHIEDAKHFKYTFLLHLNMNFFYT